MKRREKFEAFSRNRKTDGSGACSLRSRAARGTRIDGVEGSEHAFKKYFAAAAHVEFG